MLPKDMPMPMPKPGGAAPMAGGNPMPTGAAPAAAGQGSSPEQVREAILVVLQRVKSLADRYGFDLGELVSSMGGGGSPPPPASIVE